MDCPEWRLIDHTRKYKPYAAALTAHNGQLELGRSAQSVVIVKGHDRSKKAVLKEAALKRAMEESSNSEVELMPKKKVSGTIWA